MKIDENTGSGIDLTKTKSIPVNSKKAKLISEHAENSYQFIKDKDNKIQSIDMQW